MTQIGQMLIDEGMEKGMKKGIEKGIEKGMEKGIQALRITEKMVFQKKESSKSCRNVFPWTEGKRNRIWSALHRSRLDR